MTVTINVTAEHIARGKQCSERRCPIALALRDTFPNEDITVANSFVFSVTTLKKWILPELARYFVMEFDRDRHVRPFSFELDLP